MRLVLAIIAHPAKQCDGSHNLSREWFVAHAEPREP